jgi:hypothetical protein
MSTKLSVKQDSCWHPESKSRGGSQRGSTGHSIGCRVAQVSAMYQCRIYVCPFSSHLYPRRLSRSNWSVLVSRTGRIASSSRRFEIGISKAFQFLSPGFFTPLGRDVVGASSREGEVERCPRLENELARRATVGSRGLSSSFSRISVREGGW